MLELHLSAGLLCLPSFDALQLLTIENKLIILEPEKVMVKSQTKAALYTRAAHGHGARVRRVSKSQNQEVGRSDF